MVDVGNEIIDEDEEETEDRKVYQSQLPHIASLARKYLCAFSCTGNIVNVKRSCLLPENVNKLTFLANNLL